MSEPLHRHRRAQAAPSPWSATLRAPFAVLGVRTDAHAVTGVSYLPLTERGIAPRDALAERVVRELMRYLADPEFRFTVPLATGGTAFQRRVWDAIRAIPCGESRTYGEIARTVGSGPRPVGQACGANRIALIIPCHRVIGSRGALGGFMSAAGPPQGARPLWGERRVATHGGQDTSHADAEGPRAIKRWLLVHEGYRFGLF